MPIINRVADLQPDIQAWRRDIHENPELLYEVHRTAGFVADRLREFGCDEVVTGLGRTGVVGVIKGRKPAGKSEHKVIGLRADMDALPIEEATDLPYASKNPGLMHACGHDGHTAMLLGAARYLAETRNFAGDAVVIFQPAEEGGAGAAAMIKDGLMDRFKIEQVFGMHNTPGLPVGSFAIRPGPMMAATDAIDIKIEGLGGHAARPHKSIDSVLVGAQLITALQSIVSRSVDPLESAVISMCEFHAGNARNVIPQTAELRGTVRTLTPETRELVEKRVHEIVAGVAQMTGAKIDLVYERGYPVTVNHPSQTDFAIQIAKEISGDNKVHETPPMMGAEDFSYMLEARPGAFIFCGNGDTAGLHHPAYNFNDDAIPFGTSYWVKLVENTLAA
ncbi:MAG TPA: M20 aminoacylase family protein [Bradyrhizobium sp.]|jgi:hippurate hydrolase